MRLLRGLLGTLLWIVAALLGLVGVVLCVTVILLPLGIPLTVLAGRLFAHAVRLMLPRQLAHPVREVTKTTDDLAKATRKKGRKIRSTSSDAVASTTKKARKAMRKQRKLLA